MDGGKLWFSTTKFPRRTFSPTLLFTCVYEKEFKNIRKSNPRSTELSLYYRLSYYLGRHVFHPTTWVVYVLILWGVCLFPSTYYEVLLGENIKRNPLLCFYLKVARVSYHFCCSRHKKQVNNKNCPIYFWYTTIVSKPGWFISWIIKRIFLGIYF